MKPIKLFFSYSHKDEALREELVKHLAGLKRSGVLETWDDRNIDAGDEWAASIDQHINSAHIILLLISPDFIASTYCYEVEMKRAMERHESRDAVVIPVILRPCDWNNLPFSGLQALPLNADPVVSAKWSYPDEAFANIALGIRKVAEKLRSSV
ncbi:MAG: toll/interleukin-1 receptor domain-containing protein [Blastocatellia bacterium]|nr:toll/interleukin-1 receptor domain-containing protein [Blastocatellia bacterium]